ncbi:MULTISPECIES: SMP-30/gluconolactonase/LRE family protein [Marinomonas]|uniref:Gluconolactonase n=1 Tax=Marinomonas balearica TaxID=491947 RepID=A0A4R6MI65_9GAMM|nr:MULTISPECIES: SMP-30/gluconolactonase/LRE family protein [Marinomonas]TDP01277.1 gluconolactonase [Marinomonas balearica]WCN11016.1 SMP-30/gluconolactonase/LRE family protein [Marinomonas mediterranea]
MNTANGKGHSDQPEQSRRRLFKNTLALTGAAAVGASFSGGAVADPLTLRYPDVNVKVLDDSFLKYRLFNASVERLATGMRWAEGPVWSGDGRYLLVSDIANNRIMRWDEITNQFSTYRHNSNFSNGLCRDLEGRLIACEGSTTSQEGRRITRTEHNGKITVLADNYKGKRFNSPNDVVVKRDGTIWFTDPPFQSGSMYEGHIVDNELPDSVYRLDPVTGEIEAVITDIAGPNGLCFSADESVLYVVECLSKPNRIIWAYDVKDSGRLGRRRKFIEGINHGGIDGIKCDQDDNLWCGWGSTGALGVKSEELDGVMVFNKSGKAIGHILIPEYCANLCFGGTEGNRLFIASSHSVYSLYVNTRGATFV